ncbi:MAG: SDR family oxidoreductase, partial [Actinomycetota bacterium]|nr:SDR family oxidoreductase [Actinomycetota bacterium]
ALTDLDIDDWRRVLDINLTGTLLAIQSTARVMLDQGKRGSIVTIASIAAVDPLWGAPSYPVSKAGVWMLTKNASRQLAPLGVRVNSIGPGFIETNMTAIFDEVDEMSAHIIGSTPMGRKGTPDEVANVALFLASEEASYVTGELIHPDGGWFTG